jgi:hypothetical protein
VPPQICLQTAVRLSVEAATKSLKSMRAGCAIGTQSLTNVLFAIERLSNLQSEYTVIRHQFILNKRCSNRPLAASTCATWKASTVCSTEMPWPWCW